MRPSKAVKKFNGLQQYRTATAVPMDDSLDGVNVIVSGSGALEKMRVPIPLAAPLGQASNAGMFEFQQANGTREIIVTVGTQIWRFDGDQLTPTLIDDNPLNAAVWSCITSNNILFMANGQRMLKWTGVALENWGIEKPPTPTSGQTWNVTGAVSFTRTANQTQVTGTMVSVQGGIVAFSPLIGDVVTIAGAADATFNGSFPIVALSPVRWTNNGPNATTTDGSLTNVLGEALLDAAAVVSRLNGVVSVSTPSLLAGSLLAGDQVVISAATDATLNGTFIVESQIGGVATWHQFGQDFSGATATIQPASQNILAPGLSWRVAYGNSVTGHVGTASDPVNVPAKTPGQANNLYTINAVAPPSGDSQVDTLYWFRTLQGGGDYFLLKTTPLSQLWIHDTFNDSKLTNQPLAQLINNVPPVGKYLTRWQNRIFIAGITGAPQDIAYSGYERIFLGRPEESFPPNNRLRLSVGADDVRGMGAVQQGLVAWSHSNEMFILRGAVEDIVINNPVGFSAYLDELNWNQGANSHFCIQGSPNGLIWYASDNTVQIWNAAYYGNVIGPKQLSENIYPLLKRVTNSVKSTAARAEWLNFVEREWFVLLLPIDGSVSPNRIAFFDMDPGESNAGIFVSDVAADAILVHEDSQGSQHLMILQSGTLKEITFQSILKNGIRISTIAPISGLTTGLVVGPPSPLPVGNYFLRLVKVAMQGGETAMSDELGPVAGGGTKNPTISNVPPDLDVLRWRVYLGTVSGRLQQYIDFDPTAVAAAGYVVNVTGTPLTFDAPPLRKLPAFWWSGWYGNDSPDIAKMFRDGHLVTSGGGFRLSAYLVDDENYTFDKPLVFDDLTLNYGSKYSVNWTARRMSLQIKFPDADVPCSVLELSASFNPGGQR
jgi:hypothetical protein